MSGVTFTISFDFTSNENGIAVNLNTFDFKELFKMARATHHTEGVMFALSLLDCVNKTMHGYLDEHITPLYELEKENIKQTLH